MKDLSSSLLFLLGSLSKVTCKECAEDLLGDDFQDDESVKILTRREIRDGNLACVECDDQDDDLEEEITGLVAIDKSEDKPWKEVQPESKAKNMDLSGAKGVVITKDNINQFLAAQKVAPKVETVKSEEIEEIASIDTDLDLLNDEILSDTFGPEDKEEEEEKPQQLKKELDIFALMRVANQEYKEGKFKIKK